MRGGELIRQVSENLSEPVHHAFTLISLGTLFGWIIGALPTLSLFVTAVWGTLKCVEVYLAIKLKRRELER